MPKTKVDKDIEALANKKVSDLLGFVDERFIITFNEKQGVVFLGGERLTTEQCLNLKQEADLISTLQIWTIFQNTLGDIARKTIFEKSTTFEDVVRGKIMLYDLSILKKIVDTFKRFKKV